MRESIPMLPSTRSLTCSTPLAPLTPLVAPLGSGSQLGHIVRKSRGVEWGRGERNERGKEAIRSLLSERKRVSHVLPLGKSQPTARTARSGSRVGRGRYREGEKSHRRKRGSLFKTAGGVRWAAAKTKISHPLGAAAAVQSTQSCY